MVKGLIADGYDYMFEKYDAIDEIWPKYMDEKSIDGAFWQRTSVVNSGSWRKTAESEGYSAEAVQEGYTVYARIFDYTQAASFSYNVVKDHQKIKNLVKEVAAGWGETAKATREEFYARVFNKGGITTGDWIFNGTPESYAITDSSGDLAYDSKPAFNLTGNERSSKGGGTYYNGHALSLTPDNLKTILNLMEGTNNRRENDTIMRIDANVLLYPKQLRFTAKEILNSTLAPYLSTNTDNSLNSILEPIENPYLDDSDAFFIGCKKKGITALKRQEPVIDFFEEKKDRCYWATAEMRIGVMFWNWRFWSGSNFATS
jgi:hypothetical protein